MSTCPPNVGPPSSVNSIVHLLCAYTGLTYDGPICGQRATTHLRKVGADGELYGALACDPHAGIARRLGFDAEHPTGETSACDVPAGRWIDGPPSRCVIDDTGIERPVLTAQRELTPARRTTAICQPDRPRAGLRTTTSTRRHLMSTRHHLIAVLEDARRDVCAYSLQATCDCKYGLYPTSGPAFTRAITCSHRNCEHTGCPELRDMINCLQDLEDEAVEGR